MKDKTIPVRVGGATPPAKPRSDARAIEAFVSQARALAPAGNAGRLILALDATMSRQPTWDLACTLQGDMFDAVAQGRRAQRPACLFPRARRIQGVGFRRAHRCAEEADDRHRLPRRSYADRQGAGACACREQARQGGGAGLYRRRHGRARRRSLLPRPASSDCTACRCSCSRRARDGVAERTFKEIARLSKGAWFRFDRNSAATLARLLVCGRSVRVGWAQGAGSARPP